MTCTDLTSKLSKCWGTSQNIQNNAKLQNWSNYNELHRFDIKAIKMLSYVAKHTKAKRNYDKFASIWRQWLCIDVEVTSLKTFKTTQNYKTDQITMNCIDLTSKLSKCWGTSQNIQNNAKLRKWSNYPMNCIDWSSKRSKTVRVTSPNYKRVQITINLRRFDVKTIKMLIYFAKHSKQSETTKVIQIQWLASIGCQNDQNKAKLQKWSKSNELHRLDVKTIKTKLNYKSDQNPILASIWLQNDQNIQNNAKL